MKRYCLALDLKNDPDLIRQYEEHHKKITFQDEYRAFLKKYKIEYDERYLWD